MLASGFDQEAALTLLARWACFRADHEDSFDVLRWVDRTLIRFGGRFGYFEQEKPETFRLDDNMAFFPQFIYNLRRSQFLQVFNNAPDETAFYRTMLSRGCVADTSLMVQPTLFSYGFEGPPLAVLLDVSSLSPDRILVLDTYFYVVVHTGTTVAQWRSQGYQDLPEHAAFKALLEAPMEKAKGIINKRLPAPILKVCDQGGSQARFLLAKLNPSATHNQQPNGFSPAPSNSEIIFTDDVSFAVFMTSFKQLAVKPP
jgi:protein transport protein SEC23